MRSHTRLATLVAVASLAALGMSAANAAAATPATFTPCSGAPAFGCGHIVVPVDPSGATPGTLSLAVRRQLAVSGSASEAVVALAGGPGQAAIPFAAQFAQTMQAAIATRDLIVFDQRGTGYSGPLQCPSLAALNTPPSTALFECATRIGPSRAFYTTDDTVADIERIREALGYTKLVLYGTSYGTKVALRYAAQYPGNVAALVLDSTVGPNGPDVFSTSSFQAVPRILKGICAGSACAEITSAPDTDLARLLARIGNSSITGSYYTGGGHRVTVSVAAADLAAILVAGDEDPTLRADFPAAIVAALHHDDAPLALLFSHAQQTGGAVNAPLYLATECEELPFPWSRTASASTKLTQAQAGAAALPPGSFGPFSATTAYQFSLADTCAAWPYATAAPEPTLGTLPNVPTLILSGTDDLRTPTADAQAIAAQIPSATVLVVPNTGHSVLASEPSSCAAKAVSAFFNNTPIATCAATKLPTYLRPTPLAPTSVGELRTYTAKGLPGRTFAAVELTILFMTRELDDSFFEASGSQHAVSRIGGLRGGWLAVTATAITFHHFSYVPGVTLTGILSASRTVLHVGGASAAAGTLDATKGIKLGGELGGTHVGATPKA